MIRSVGFFSELGTRRVHLAGCMTSLTAAWVMQQTHQLSGSIQGGRCATSYLVHDRDGKVVPGVDAVVRSEDAAVMKTPNRAPTANTIAERWVGSVRRECLDHP